MPSTQPQAVPPTQSANAQPDFIPSALTGWIGVIGFVLGVIWLNRYGQVIAQLNQAHPSLHLQELKRYWEALVLLGFTAVPMIVCDALLLRSNAHGGPIDGITK